MPDEGGPDSIEAVLLTGAGLGALKRWTYQASRSDIVHRLFIRPGFQQDT